MSPFTNSLRRFSTALACSLAVTAIAVPLAQAHTDITDNSAGQNRVDSRNAYGPPDPWQYRFIITENSASQNRVDRPNAYGPPDPWQYRFLHPKSSTGYRFITENSASQNRLPSAIVASRAVSASRHNFDWLSAGTGATAGLVLTLLVIARRTVRGKSDRVAPAR